MHSIDVLISSEFLKYPYKIFLYHENWIDADWIWFSTLYNDKNQYFNTNSSITISAIKNNSKDLDRTFYFYGSWFLWKNEIYSFFLIDNWWLEIFFIKIIRNITII